jgi:hypothetical protein
MKASGRHERRGQPESIEFVPKGDLLQMALDGDKGVWQSA